MIVIRYTINGAKFKRTFTDKVEAYTRIKVLNENGIDVRVKEH